MDDDMAAKPARDARQALLDRVIEHLSARGSSDLTLRGVAAGVGTSHRMLAYHFGSLDGLVTAVVGEVEQRQRDALADLAADPELSLADVSEAVWDRVRDPDLHPMERLFFQLYARGLLAENTLAETLVLPWLEQAEALAADRGLDKAQARALARLGMAVTRGLLLDLLATGDVDGVDEAMRLYLQQVSAIDPAARQAPATAKAKPRRRTS